MAKTASGKITVHVKGHKKKNPGGKRKTKPIPSHYRSTPARKK